MSKSNMFPACVALMAICAALVFVSALWFALAQGAECAELQRWPLAILGGLILLVALIGFLNAYLNCRLARPILKLYFIVMAAGLIILTGFIVFVFIVTGGSGAYPVMGRAYDEYRLDGFSMWLRSYVSDNPAQWQGIMSCLAESDTCKKLARQASFVTADQFYMSNLTPLQSGCCKPPSVCGFGYVGPTVWTNATSAPVQDCGLWSNDPAQLCYECESCRAGLLATVRSQWRQTAGIALGVLTVLLFIIHFLSWWAYKYGGAIWGRRKR